MAGIDRSVEIEVQDFLPVLDLHVPEILVVHYVGTRHVAAGHVDEDVDPPVFGDDLVGKPCDLGRVHHVARIGGRVPAQLCQCLISGSDLFGPVHEGNDIRTL